MTRPDTKAQAVTRWRAESLAILSEVRLSLTALETLVRAGVTDRRLEGSVEDTWDAAGRIARIGCGPEVSAEEIAEGNPMTLIAHTTKGGTQ